MKFKKQEVVFDTVVNSFELKFENEPYKIAMETREKRKDASLPIKAGIIFEMFPFCLLFNEELVVNCMGVALRMIIPKLVEKKVTEYFELVKPLIEFKFEIILSRKNNMFEIATQDEIDKLTSVSGATSQDRAVSEEDLLEEDVDKTLHIKGQMAYIEEWQQMLFLACPIMKDMNNLVWSGLFVNELSMHDYSRDIMLFGSMEQIEMKMALQGAEIKAANLANQVKKFEETKKKTEKILSQMLPKQVADDLKSGKSPMDTCEAYPEVTMLFSDIVTFTVICSRIQPIEVVMLLNNLYTLFDFLVDQNAVYKVETIGDAYLIVAGCPVKAANHYLKIVDMAFDMMDGIKMLRDPGTGKDIGMRIGCHTGSVVAGVVGLKMPRFCLFGVNVGLTEKFESNSKPMRIHISEPCKALLPAQYKLEERTAEAEPELAAKVGGMKSYFLNSKDGRNPLKEAVIKALLPKDTEKPKMDTKDKKEEKKTDGKKADDGKAPEAKAAEASPAPAAPAAGSGTESTPPPPPPAGDGASSAPPPNGDESGNAEAAAPDGDGEAPTGSGEEPAAEGAEASTENEDQADGEKEPAAKQEDGNGEQSAAAGPLQVEVVDQACCGGFNKNGKSGVCNLI